MTQTVLTVVGAYGCFYVAEGLLGASGVMAVVFMGGWLSYSFWPVLADPELLTGTWHTLEWLRVRQRKKMRPAVRLPPAGWGAPREATPRAPPHGGRTSPRADRRAT